jgi:hypothetical protein
MRLLDAVSKSFINLFLTIPVFFLVHFKSSRAKAIIYGEKGTKIAPASQMLGKKVFS